MSIADLSPQELTALVRNASAHKTAAKSSSLPAHFTSSLAGKTIALTFSKRSTRTRVSTEAAAAMMGAHPMFLGSQDIQLGVPRKDALRRLADRNGVDELRRFVLAVIQAEGYGVPIARVLRLQAAELREKRRQKAEEHAQKLSIKLLFPLVFCILPVVFIVILGPAVYGFMDAMGGRG